MFMLKKKFVAAGIGLAFIASAAVAGYVQPAPVMVDLTARIAQGDTVTARYSKNKVEFIGCGIRKQATPGGVFTFGFCQARDAAGVQIICNSQNAELLDAISSSADFGFILFSWNEDNECTRIGFSNQSFYLPEKLAAN
jgi:hypothetical protein